MCSRSICVVIILVAGSASSQMLSSGQCPNVSVVENFDFNAFSGRWYELLRYPHWYDITGECSWFDFSTVDPPADIRYSFVYYPVRLSIWEKGLALNRSGVFKVTLPFEGRSDFTMHVLATDYISYALLYDCETDLDLKIKKTSSWILSRSMNRTEESRQAILSVMRPINGLEEVLHKKVDFSDSACFSYYDANVTNISNSDDF